VEQHDGYHRDGTESVDIGSMTQLPVPHGRSRTQLRY
jgi:hypothetical protein